MLTIQIPNEIESHLQPLAQAAGKSAKDYIYDAFFEFLEDLEDLHIAKQELAAIKAGKSRVYSSEEIRKELGLDDQL